MMLGITLCGSVLWLVLQIQAVFLGTLSIVRRLENRPGATLAALTFQPPHPSRYIYDLSMSCGTEYKYAQTVFLRNGGTFPVRIFHWLGS
jgi:hypothetical protein